MTSPLTIGSQLAAAGASVVTAGIALNTLLKDEKNILRQSFSKQNAESLAERLCAKRMDYQKEVRREKRKAPSETYNNWIKRAKLTEEQIATLIVRYNQCEEENVPLEITKDFENQKIVAEDLIKESDDMKDKLMVEAPIKHFEEMVAPDLKRFKTLQGHLDNIVSHLQNEDINGVTVYGNIGVGKTTILKNLNNHKKMLEMFDIIIWLKVSTDDDLENSSIQHLQETILKRLRLTLEDTKSSGDVADRISKELKGMRYLFLLDGVNQDITLSDIGIPLNEKGCKLVLTSRRVHVCRQLVNVAVKVTHLSDDEAWLLFRDVLRSPFLDENAETEEIAYLLCRQCGGLPLVIEKVASTFKVKNSDRDWPDGLASWRTWPKKEGKAIEEVIEPLTICYNTLDDDQKKCFRYVALYPEENDIYTDCLLECWRAEEFIYNKSDYEEGSETTATSNAIARGNSILNHLKNVSLLETGKGDKYVTMHKFIRVVALGILLDDPECLYLVKTDGALKETVDDKLWHEKRYISLSKNVGFCKLPDQPSGNKLSTLFLQKNSTLKEVPDSFFNNMIKLQVLDLSESGITLVPESLPRSLIVLILSGCMGLNALPSTIEDNLCLEVIDFRRSGVVGVPTHLEKVKRLRCLRISIPQNTNEIGGFQTIKKLEKLEELVVDVGRVEELSNTSVVCSIVNSVVVLEKFTNLKFSFPDHVVDMIYLGPRIFRIQAPDAKVFHGFPRESCLYNRAKWLDISQIFIGCDKKEKRRIPDLGKYRMYVKHCGGEDDELNLFEQFDKDIAFELVGHKTITELSNFRVGNTTSKIKAFFVGSCLEIETIIGAADNKVLSDIQHLYLDTLPKLESIWKDPSQNLCFRKLETLFLSGCPKLMTIFPPGALERLTEIQTLKIGNCSEVVEIFEESETMGKPHVLPKLKKLVIENMPKLEFISKESLLNWPSLIELRVSGCPRFQKATFTISNAPELDDMFIV